MRILIIGSLQGHATVAAHLSMKNGAKVLQSDTLDDGLKILRSAEHVDLVLVDVLLGIPYMMNAMISERICTPVIACGVNANPKLSKQAIEAGAKDYIPLPPDPDLIAAILSTVSHDKSDIIVCDPAMQHVIALADKIAPSDASVFLSGESGTGKEVLAKYIHQKSKRALKPFVSINCAAIPESLLESELFGHEKGAFTGAIARRIGKFEEASGGTLLLDEISEMHVRLQAKLLRAIQERVIDRVGGEQSVPIDIRILATSNRDMMKAIEAGDFREDLYFRLNVVTLKIPPLRQRTQDIIPLANHFVTKYCALNSMPVKALSVDAEQSLRTQYWRGNIRELENTIHRAVLLSGQTIEKSDVSVDKEDEKSIHIGRTIADVEKDLILGTLNHCLGNRTHAATILGISIRTLRNKLKEYQDHDQKPFIIPYRESLPSERHSC